MPVEKTTKETVVLVHGLWMHGWVMTLLALRLKSCGFHTVTFSYPSMSNSLSQNARLLSNFVADITASHLHFVGHSLGGVLVMQMLSEFPDKRTRRVILAGSPCNMCYAANKLARSKLTRPILGRSILQLLEQKTLECPGWYEAGTIAGCKSFGVGRLLSGLPNPNDGVIAVEETKMLGACDQIVLNVSHTGILVSARVAYQVCMFLKYGKFSHNL